MAKRKQPRFFCTAGARIGSAAERAPAPKTHGAGQPALQLAKSDAQVWAPDVALDAQPCRQVR